MNWFTVDKAGLAAVLERRGKFFALAELVANAWDSGTDRVAIRMTPIEGAPYATLEVEDFGEGFADLGHANTLFARSRRAAEPEKRGRFNLGEKLVLAVCRKARIETTTGTVHFNDDGSVRNARAGRTTGTLFAAEIRMTREEFADVCRQVRRLLPPVRTTFNEIEIERPDSIARFEVKLPTEIADADGNLRKTIRTAAVEVYEADGQSDVLELGVPVVETETGWRVNVLQKIPLNMERDNATPAFLRAVNVAVLNAVADRMTSEQAAAPWAAEAMGDARATPEAVRTMVRQRFGEHAVIANPADPVANANAARNGFTVVSGGALSADAWANVRKSEILLPSSRVFPTPRPEDIAAQQDPDGGQGSRCPVCGK